MAIQASKLSLFAILLLAGATAIASESPAPSPSPISGAMGGKECKHTLVSVSRCLPFISAPPNNESSLVPPECCDAYFSIFYAGEVSCLCYFLKEPQVFGFPIDRSRLFSLSSSCPLPNVTLPANGASIEFVCSVLQALPPLGSAGHGTLELPVAGPEASSSSIVSAPDNSPPSFIITPDATPEASISLPYPPPNADTEYPPDYDTEYPETSSATRLRMAYCGFMNLLGNHPEDNPFSITQTRKQTRNNLTLSS